jgi:hypothetical protein
LLPLSLEYLELLEFLVHQLFLSDQEYLEFLADLLDLLAQLALEYLVFLASPVLPCFQSDLYFPLLLLPLYFL